MTLKGGGENDVGRDGDPKGVLADKRNLDEYPDDCESRENERERKSIIHPDPPGAASKKPALQPRPVSELAKLMMGLSNASGRHPRGAAG
jgi:hypothetical protein